MFKMTFEFTDREDTDLRYINAALSGMKLSKLNSMVNTIAVNTQLQYNFEKNASQSESYSMHR